MTKAEVIAEISSKTGIDKAEVAASLEAFFSVVKENLANGENIYVRGFGSFVVKRREVGIRKGLRSRMTERVPAHNVPSFKPSKVFVEKIRGSEGMLYPLGKQKQVDSLKLYFNSSEYSPKDIAQIISGLSQLYAEIGGDSLIIDSMEMYSTIKEQAPKLV